MALYDHEAAGNAGIYLRLPEEQLLSIRNATYPGKVIIFLKLRTKSFILGCSLGPKQEQGLRERYEHWPRRKAGYTQGQNWR